MDVSDKGAFANTRREGKFVSVRGIDISDEAVLEVTQGDGGGVLPLRKTVRGGIIACSNNLSEGKAGEMR